MADAIIGLLQRCATATVWLACLIGGPGCERRPAAAPQAPALERAAIEASLDDAERCVSTGDAAGARAILVRLLQSDPPECRAHEPYGRVLYLLGLQAQAASDEAGWARFIGEAHDQYQAAIRCAAPAPAGLHQSAGEIAAAAGRQEAALVHFRDAARLEPGDPKHPLYEAQVLLRLGRLAEAQDALERVLAIDPRQPFAHATLASIAMDRGDPEAAFAHIEEARRPSPGDLALRLHEASIRRRGGQGRRALELLIGLDQRTRAQEPFAAEIAACWRSLGDPAAAAAAWELRYRLDPDGLPACRAALRAAEAHLEAGDPEAARWWCAAARAAAPGSPEIAAVEQAIQSGRPGP